MRVPLAVPNLDGREAEYLQECITSTFVSSAGPFVVRFEEQIAALSEEIETLRQRIRELEKPEATAKNDQLA